ncbi:MAG: RNA-metabolising [Erysipelotrichaceae bacterium]|nr:MAG: RNA-metabolising [Erysipelotrichaceae bacterium]
MEQIRLFALGGLDEDGKNLTVVEINDDIFVIDAGLKYPEADHLGIEMIIPDFSYLVENKHRIKAVFITQGHDDVMAALPYLLKVAKVPVYTTPLTAMIIENLCKKFELKDVEIHRIKRNGVFTIGSRKIRTFGITHSIADAFGIGIWTEYGWIVYTGEFIIDFDVHNDAFQCDITEFSELGKQGVLALMTESVGADRVGHTSPSHKISSYFEKALDEAPARLIATLYEQNVYRLIEVLDLAAKYKKKVFFYNEDQRTLLRHVEKLGYYRMPVGIEISRENFSNNRDDLIILVSGSGPKVFNTMYKIAMAEDKLIELRKEDTIIILSPMVPGTEKESGRMENELYKEDVSIITLDRKKVTSMHASIEDLKMITYLLKPKYYIPVHGEYRHLINNANVALDMGYQANKIVVLDNGQIATFKEGELKDMTVLLKLEEIMIDGNEHLDVSGLILKDRELLSTDGVIVIGMVVNFNSKAVIGGPDVQSRGVIYLKDADYIVKELGHIFESTINDYVSAKKYENMAVRLEAKDRMSKYLMKETGKRPLLLPVIVELNLPE